MATQLQIRRGTSTQVAAFTGAEGEIVVNTTNDSIHVNDGSTAGGFEMARADLNNVSDTDLNAALTGNTVSALTITTLTLGATAITATGAELNILDGVTATATELNLLDGVTATTAELNYVDGVTSAIQTQIDTKAPLASPTFTGTATMGGLEIATSASDIGVDLKLDGNKTSNGAIGSIIFENNGDSVGMIRSNRASANDAADMLFYTQATGGANTQRMAITKDGNLLVGTPTAHLTSSTFAGYTQFAGGHSIQKRSGGIVAYYDRLTDDGTIMQFRRQGATVGMIAAVAGRIGIGQGDSGLFFDDDNNKISPVTLATGTPVDSDGLLDLGYSGARYKDLYLSGAIDGGQLFHVVVHTLYDDSVYVLDPPNSIGIVMLAGRNDNYDYIHGIVSYRTSANTYATQMGAGNANVLIGEFSGVPGVSNVSDGYFSVVVSDNGNIYFWNRLGLAVSVSITLFGA